MINETEKVISFHADKTPDKPATHTINKLSIKGVVYKLPISIEVDDGFKVNYPEFIVTKLFEHYGYPRELTKKYGEEFSRSAVTAVCFLNGYYIPMKVRPLFNEDTTIKMYTEVLNLMAKEYKWPIVEEENDDG